MASRNGFSVLMPVYQKDNPSWLKEALESIYENQTVKPSEIVLVKDGPLSKELEKVLNEYVSKTKILKVVSLPRNMGVHIALNEGLKHCSYEWVARMDADDISLPNRFEIQLKAIEKNPEIVLIGGYIEEFDENMNNSVGIRKVPLAYKEIIKFAKKRSPFNHMTVMFKKSIVLKEGGYPSFRYGQDYALWVKLLVKGYKCLNVPYIIVRVRGGHALISRRHGIKYLRNEFNLLRYFRRLGFYTNKDLVFYGIPRLMTRILPKDILGILYKRFLRS